MEYRIQQLNPYVRGWMGYLRHPDWTDNAAMKFQSGIICPVTAATGSAGTRRSSVW
ncbi:group II intron maturase-specific domain-containing protein [Arthrobacter sp. TMN-49]